jgi:hypothetical protein
MNQQQNAISLASVSAVSLVGESQAVNLVKHRLGSNNRAFTNSKLALQCLN